MSELKPCPFCGATPIWSICGENNDLLRFGCPNNCAVWMEPFTRPYHENALKSASERWNRRAQPVNEPPHVVFRLCPHCGKEIAYASPVQPTNEPLTLDDGFDITNADGTPIDYAALGKRYRDQLCYCDIDGFYIGEDGELVLMDDCGKAVPVDRGDYHIEARPTERSKV